MGHDLKSTDRDQLLEAVVWSFAQRTRARALDRRARYALVRANARRSREGHVAYVRGILTSMKHKLTELAYAAGLFDGEGHIVFQGKDAGGHRRSLQVSIINTDEIMLNWLLEHFGGALISQKVTGNRKPCWHWRLRTDESLAFLYDILPYVVSKENLVRKAIDSREQYLTR